MSGNSLSRDQIALLIEWEQLRRRPDRELYDKALAEMIAVEGEDADAVRNFVRLGESFLQMPDFESMDDEEIAMWKRSVTFQPEKEDLTVPGGRKSSSRVRHPVHLQSGKDQFR